MHAYTATLGIERMRIRVHDASSPDRIVTIVDSAGGRRCIRIARYYFLWRIWRLSHSQFGTGCAVMPVCVRRLSPQTDMRAIAISTQLTTS
jgi:hypothetical protein